MHEIEAKTILSQKNGVNLYRGCTHGCIYCDSRSACYGMEHDFEDVAVKTNGIALLDDALRRKRRPVMIGTGSMADPYMPIEATLRLTQKTLKTAEKYNCGVTLITKSDLVLRDIDLLDRINRKTKAVVQMTLTTYDEELCRKIEPCVATTHRRYEVLKECRKRGIPTVVWLCPILPYINDTEENLNGILDYCLDAGVAGILNFGFGLTLREGNREYFYQKLDELFPGLKEKYIRRFGDSYECESENGNALWKTFYARLKNSGVMISAGEIFSYLSALPQKEDQISFFDGE